MRTGKTKVLYEQIMDQVSKGIEAYVVGNNTVIIDLLKDKCLVQPIFATHIMPQREMYKEDGLIKQIIKYEPTIIGWTINKKYHIGNS